MELFIRANDIYMEIHKVTLKEGHIPMIGDHLPPSLKDADHGYTNPYKIEPAVWFKVKVVDSISIDCTKRVIMWNSDSSLPYVNDSHPAGEEEGQCENATPGGAALKRQRRVSESMYIGGELYGFESDLDELFDTLQLAVVNFASSSITREVFNCEIMRMLHCHVLPLVKLTTEDVPKMRELYREEEECIKAIDELILLKDKQMDEIASAMQRQRSSFLSNLVTVTDTRSTLSGPWKMCNKKVAKMLVEDFEADISEVYQRLDDLQKDVEEAKLKLSEEGNTNIRDSFVSDMVKTNETEPIVNCTNRNELPASEKETNSDESVDYEKILLAKRCERNDCHRRYEKLLYARENLKDYINETEDEPEKPQRRSFLNHFHRSSRHQEEPLHNIYIAMREKLEDVRKEAKALIDKKVLMISVKEAIRTTLEELELHDESTGYDVGVMHGSRPTDVLHRSRKPKDWLSLAEKISELVGHHSNQACLQHNNFCKVIADRCQAAVYEKQLVDISYNVLRTGPVSDNGRDGMSSNSDSGVYVENKLCTLAGPSERGSEIDGDACLRSEPAHTSQGDTMSPIESIVSDSSDLSDSACDSQLSPEVTNLSDLCLYEGSVQAVPGTGGTSHSLLQVEGQLGDEEIVIVHSNNSKDHLRKVIDEIKAQTHTHFKDISRLIQGTLDTKTHVAFKKIWLCYENYFYEMMMSPMMDLYRAAFKPVTVRLQNLVPALTVEDLDLDDTAIANMLEEEVVADAVSETSPSEKSEDLIEGAGVKPENNNTLEDPFEMDEDVPGVDSDSAPPKVELRKTPNPKRGFRRRLNTHPLQVECGNTVFPGQVSPRGDLDSGSNGLKRIKIHYPVSVTVIGHRQSWPRSTLPEITENVELAVDALNGAQKQTEKSTDETFKNIRKSLFTQQDVLPEVSEVSNQADITPIVHHKVILKPEFQEQFTVAKACLAETLNGKTPLSQLQSLMRCLREVTNCLSDYQYKYCSSQSGACSDDIIDMLIILLLNCDVSLTAALYPHLMFLTDTLPPFFEGGPFQFCLVQFSVAYQFLQDRLLLKNRSLPMRS